MSKWVNRYRSLRTENRSIHRQARAPGGHGKLLLRKMSMTAVVFETPPQDRVSPYGRKRTIGRRPAFVWPRSLRGRTAEPTTFFGRSRRAVNSYTRISVSVAGKRRAGASAVISVFIAGLEAFCWGIGGDVDSLHRKITKAGNPYAANRTLAVVDDLSGGCGAGWPRRRHHQRSSPEPAWDWDEVVAGVASQTQASDLDVTTVVAVQRAANVNPIVRQIQKRSFGGGGGYRRKVRRARSGGLCIGVRALLAGLRGELRVSAKATQLLATALLVASCSRRCTPASYSPQHRRSRARSCRHSPRPCPAGRSAKRGRDRPGRRVVRHAPSRAACRAGS
jgi:hypothetical protein